ncbi:hypothetical protein D3C73_1503930 [compost metagenome]
MDTPDVPIIHPYPILTDISPLESIRPSYLQFHGTICDASTEIFHEHNAGLNMIEQVGDFGIVVAEGC